MPRKKDKSNEILADGMPADFGIFPVKDEAIEMEIGEIEEDGLPSNFSEIIKAMIKRHEANKS